jgi:hypothetical protein
MLDTYRRKKLEERRQSALLGIHYERSRFEEMAQRAKGAGETPDVEFYGGVLARLLGLEQRAIQETNIDEFDDLVEQAEQQGTLRAYICPRTEVEDEGRLAIDVMAEWGVPKAIVERLRDSLGQKLKDTDTQSARGALRAIFEENNSWASYTDDYEDTMRGYTRWLFGATFFLLVLTVTGFYFRLKAFPLVFLGTLLCGGAAGSCVSVMLKLPLFDVSLSGELDAYGRRIWSRTGAGTVASLIGCAFLGWGVLPVSLQNQTFSDVVNACAAADAALCTITKALILLAISILFGFSERTLASIERRVLGGE